MSSKFIKESTITVQRPPITVTATQSMPMEMAAEDFFGIDLHHYFSFEGYSLTISGTYKTLDGRQVALDQPKYFSGYTSEDMRYETDMSGAMHLFMEAGQAYILFVDRESQLMLGQYQLGTGGGSLVDSVLISKTLGGNIKVQDIGYKGDRYAVVS